MLQNNYLYGVVGRVSDILTPDKAIIQFELRGKSESAFLKGDRFFHNGKRIPEDHNLNKYIRCGSQVKFSCHIFDKSEFHEYGWFVGMCWLHDDSERNVVTLSTGMENISGQVSDLKQRQGLLLMTDSFGKEHKVHFLASKFYLYGKRLPASKSLSSELSLEDRVFFDATPCFPEENHYSCCWFATCVYKGKKPELAQYKDPSLKKDFEPADKEAWKQNKKDEKPIKTKDRAEQLIDSEEDTGKGFRLTLPNIKLVTNNPRSVFATGRGMIMNVINDEYAVIMGVFKRNVLQTILFHRSNASLFKMSLAHSKLSEIFIEGDRVRFIAVGAPEEFVTDWVATQVSVLCPARGS